PQVAEPPCRQAEGKAQVARTKRRRSGRRIDTRDPAVRGSEAGLEGSRSGAARTAGRRQSEGNAQRRKTRRSVCRMRSLFRLAATGTEGGRQAETLVRDQHRQGGQV